MIQGPPDQLACLLCAWPEIQVIDDSVIGLFHIPPISGMSAIVERLWHFKQGYLDAAQQVYIPLKMPQVLDIRNTICQILLTAGPSVDDATCHTKTALALLKVVTGGRGYGTSSVSLCRLQADRHLPASGMCFTLWLRFSPKPLQIRHLPQLSSEYGSPQILC